VDEQQFGAVKQSLSRFIEELRQAKDLYHSLDDGGRAGAQVAINAAATVVTTIEDIGEASEAPFVVSREEGLEEPLLAVSVALSDLTKGSQHDMLKPVPVRGRKPDTFMRRTAVRVFSAVTMELFMREGFRREVAAREVARHLSKRGISRPGQSHLTWETVANWRDELHNSPEDDIPSVMAKDLLELLPRQFDATVSDKLDLLGRLDAVLDSCKVATDSS
jgi:hypothetical protein